MKTKLVAVFPVLALVVSLSVLGAGPQNILGVTVSNPSGSGTGVQIVAVAPNSPCSSVLPAGDIIAYLNPNGGLTGNRNQDLAFEVSNLTDFQSLVGKIKPGATATFLLVSGTSAMAPPWKVSCTIPANGAAPAANTPAYTAAPPPAPALTGAALLGIKAKVPSGMGTGVKITAIAPGNPCSPALNVGDVISALNPSGPLSNMRAQSVQYEIRDMTQFENLASQIKPGTTATMIIFPGGSNFSMGRTITCSFPAAPGGAPGPSYNAAPASSSAPASGLSGGALLGITTQKPFGNSGGVAVASVAASCPCQSLLHVGDVISFMNPNGSLSGAPASDRPYQTRDQAQFESQASQIRPGATVSLKVLPASAFLSTGNIVTCNIPASGGAASSAYSAPASAYNAPAGAYPPAAVAPPNILGIVVADELSNPEKNNYVGGLRVKEVQPGSPCAGVLSVGNVITYLSPNGPIQMPPTVRANAGKHLQDMNDFNRLLAEVKPGATVGFLLYPGRSMFEMAHTAKCTIPASAAP